MTSKSNPFATFVTFVRDHSAGWIGVQAIHD